MQVQRAAPVKHHLRGLQLCMPASPPLLLTVWAPARAQHRPRVRGHGLVQPAAAGHQLDAACRKRVVMVEGGDVVVMGHSHAQLLQRSRAALTISAGQHKHVVAARQLLLLAAGQGEAVDVCGAAVHDTHLQAHGARLAGPGTRVGPASAQAPSSPPSTVCDHLAQALAAPAPALHSAIV